VHDDLLERFIAMRDALNATGRPIVYSLCEWVSLGCTAVLPSSVRACFHIFQLMYHSCGARFTGLNTE
jgi:hypothetical protein